MSLRHALFVAFTNYTCVKSFMEPCTYKVVNTHAHEISGRKTLFRLLHSCVPNLKGINGGVWSDLSTLAFNNGEQLEYL